jgi:hypothetical protein
MSKITKWSASCFQTRKGVGAHLYGPGSALLEGTAVDTLVEVDGVLARYDILQCATLTSLSQMMSCQAYDRREGRRERGDGRTLFLPFVVAGDWRIYKT